MTNGSYALRTEIEAALRTLVKRTDKRNPFISGFNYYLVSLQDIIKQTNDPIILTFSHLHESEGYLSKAETFMRTLGCNYIYTRDKKGCYRWEPSFEILDEGRLKENLSIITSDGLPIDLDVMPLDGSDGTRQKPYTSLQEILEFETRMEVESSSMYDSVKMGLIFDTLKQLIRNPQTCNKYEINKLLARFQLPVTPKTLEPSGLTWLNLANLIADDDGIELISLFEEVDLVQQAAPGVLKRASKMLVDKKGDIYYNLCHWLDAHDIPALIIGGEIDKIHSAIKGFTEASLFRYQHDDIGEYNFVISKNTEALIACEYGKELEHLGFAMKPCFANTLFVKKYIDKYIVK